jgi:hypothetical protein
MASIFFSSPMFNLVTNSGRAGAATTSGLFLLAPARCRYFEAISEATNFAS